MNALLGAIGILLVLALIFVFVVLLQPAAEVIAGYAFFFGLPLLILGAGIYYNSVVLCLIGILFSVCTWGIWKEGRK